MNTFEPKDSIPEIVAGSAAPSTPALALAPVPQPTTPAITPPQLHPPPGSLADAAFGGVVSEVDALSEPEEQRLRICEATIQAGQHSFVEMGLALGEIREGRLYRNDFTTFEEYCQRRWEFKRGKADYLISAARVCHRISEAPGLPQPDRASQLRPLLAVSEENAGLAWQYAVQSSCGRPVTARRVKRAIQELKLALVNVRPAPAQDRQSKRELRQVISGTMDELLGLITRKADHGVLLAKFEALHGQFQLLFKPRKPKN